MALCLMQINQCSFSNCGQYFANQYDLIAHIEYTHIPMIEDEMKKRSAVSNGNGMTPTTGDEKNEKEKDSKMQNVPLSIISRVFRTAYRPNPIKHEPMKVSFNHYKRRAQRELAAQAYAQQTSSLLYRQQNSQMMAPNDDDSNQRLADVDIEECAANDPEVRFRCQVVDCTKRYKNSFALRLHMRSAHNYTVPAINPNPEAVNQMQYQNGQNDQRKAAYQLQQQQLTQNQFQQQNVQNQIQQQNVQSQMHQQNQLNLQHQSQVNQLQTQSQSNQQGYVTTSGALTPAGMASTNMANGIPMGSNSSASKPHKCSFCSKRYKTPNGLSNHLMHSHQKPNSGNESPTPAVVEKLITQARMQRQQQEQLQQHNGGGSTPTSQTQTSPPRQMSGVSVSYSGQQQSQPQQQRLPGGTGTTPGTHSGGQTNPGQQQQITAQSMIPPPSHVRSYTVTTTSQLRFSQPHHPATLNGQPTTGQMLQIQMQQAKRLQMQQQQQQSGPQPNVQTGQSGFDSSRQQQSQQAQLQSSSAPNQIRNTSTAGPNEQQNIGGGSFNSQQGTSEQAISASANTLHHQQQQQQMFNKARRL